MSARAQVPQNRPPDASEAVSLQQSIYSLFENNKDSVVKVYARKDAVSKDADGNETHTTILDVGSGFIASKTGAVMTSAFITRGARKLWIEYGGRLLDAESVGFDPITTVSIIKIAGSFKSADLPVVVIDPLAEPVKPATGSRLDLARDGACSLAENGNGHGAEYRIRREVPADRLRAHQPARPPRKHGGRCFRSTENSRE